MVIRKERIDVCAGVVASLPYDMHKRNKKRMQNTHLQTNNSEKYMYITLVFDIYYVCTTIGASMQKFIMHCDINIYYQVYSYHII